METVVNKVDDPALLPDDGGPAFPQAINDMGTLTVVDQGMTLRDYFAGQALVGKYVDGTANHDLQWQDIASQCYMAADAMLAARVDETADDA